MGETLGIDFDKTLTDPDADEWSKAKDNDPNEDMIEAVREAFRSGKTIIIWTARQWWEAPQIVGWLQTYEVPFHGLRCGKGGADRYVDDKTESPEKFAETRPIDKLRSSRSDSVDLVFTGQYETK